MLFARLDGALLTAPDYSTSPVISQRPVKYILQHS